MESKSEKIKAISLGTTVVHHFHSLPQNLPMVPQPTRLDIQQMILETRPCIACWELVLSQHRPAPWCWEPLFATFHQSGFVLNARWDNVPTRIRGLPLLEPAIPSCSWTYLWSALLLLHGGLSLKLSVCGVLSSMASYK
jgi:hypothetical protein